MNKSDVILLFAAIMVGLDALANGFLLLYAPKWMDFKGKEIKELREQNSELRRFIREVLHERGNS